MNFGLWRKVHFFIYKLKFLNLDEMTNYLQKISIILNHENYGKYTINSNKQSKCFCISKSLEIGQKADTLANVKLLIKK